MQNLNRLASPTQGLWNKVQSWIGGEFREIRKSRILARAEKGLPEAQFKLALLYENGELTAPTPYRSIQLLRSAAYHGVLKAQLYLARKYLTGTDVSKNEPEAMVWFRKAADKGNPEAQYQLGQLLAGGIPTGEVDLCQAIKWLRKAQSQGHAQAAELLASLMNPSGDSGELASQAA